MNPCFELLDRAVIQGRADEPVTSDPDVSHARLLEDVGAVGGVLRAVGVEPGHRVSVTPGDDATAVIAALATLRVGAVPTTDPAPVSVADRAGISHLVWAEDTALDWPGVLSAGRTDPAPAHATPAGDAAAEPDLRGLSLPVSMGELRVHLLGV